MQLKKVLLRGPYGCKLRKVLGNRDGFYAPKGWVWMAHGFGSWHWTSGDSMFAGRSKFSWGEIKCQRK